MSNQVKLRKRSFTDADGEVTWGWTLQDDYWSVFDDSHEQEELNVKGLALLRLVVKFNADPTYSEEHARAILISCWELEKGMYIDGIFYDYEVIQGILKELL